MFYLSRQADREDVENIVYSDPYLGGCINSFMISVEEDDRGDPHPCFEFELQDISQKAGVEEKLAEALPQGLAKLSLDFKKAREEFPQATTPIIRIFGMNRGPFLENQGRIKKRYVKKGE